MPTAPHARRRAPSAPTSLPPCRASARTPGSGVDRPRRRRRAHPWSMPVRGAQVRTPVPREAVQASWVTASSAGRRAAGPLRSSGGHGRCEQHDRICTREPAPRRLSATTTTTNSAKTTAAITAVDRSPARFGAHMHGVSCVPRPDRHGVAPRRSCTAQNEGVVPCRSKRPAVETPSRGRPIEGAQGHPPPGSPGPRPPAPRPCPTAATDRISSFPRLGVAVRARTRGRAAGARVL